MALMKQSVPVSGSCIRLIESAQMFSGVFFFLCVLCEYINLQFTGRDVDFNLLIFLHFLYFTEVLPNPRGLVGHV